MNKDENLLAAASYFWSDTLNAFLFGHGPMTPSLMDVIMLTGLDISSSDKCMAFEGRSEHKIDCSKMGWGRYIELYAKSRGPIDAKEHYAFLLMWLEKFVFCRKSLSPSPKHLKLAEGLAAGINFPLGKHLLGAVYHMMHQVATLLRNGEAVANIGGPWWFLNLWPRFF
jgi:hypothetical protein